MYWWLLSLHKKLNIFVLDGCSDRNQNNVGQEIRYRARLVTKDFMQQYGVDYDELFALVSLFLTVCDLLAIIFHQNMYYLSIDIESAFFMVNCTKLYTCDDVLDSHQKVKHIVFRLCKAICME